MLCAGKWGWWECMSKCLTGTKRSFLPFYQKSKSLSLVSKALGGVGTPAPTAPPHSPSTALCCPARSNTCSAGEAVQTDFETLHSTGPTSRWSISSADFIFWGLLRIASESPAERITLAFIQRHLLLVPAGSSKLLPPRWSFSTEQV